MRIWPMSLWSALVASSAQRGRRLRVAVGDELGMRAGAHGVFSVFDQADDPVLGGFDLAFAGS